MYVITLVLALDVIFYEIFTSALPISQKRTICIDKPNNVQNNCRKNASVMFEACNVHELFEFVLKTTHT